MTKDTGHRIAAALETLVALESARAASDAATRTERRAETAELMQGIMDRLMGMLAESARRADGRLTRLDREVFGKKTPGPIVRRTHGPR